MVPSSGATCRRDPYFGFQVPEALPGIDNRLLDPIQTWPDADSYHATACKLVDLFIENFHQFEVSSGEFSQYGPKRT